MPQVPIFVLYVSIKFAYKTWNTIKRERIMEGSKTVKLDDLTCVVCHYVWRWLRKRWSLAAGCIDLKVLYI